MNSLLGAVVLTSVIGAGAATVAKKLPSKAPAAAVDTSKATPPKDVDPLSILGPFAGYVQVDGKMCPTFNFKGIDGVKKVVTKCPK